MLIELILEPDRKAGRRGLSQDGRRLADPAGDGHPGLRSDLWPRAAAEEEMSTGIR